MPAQEGNGPTDGREEWLIAHHSRWRTPDDTLTRIVRSAGVTPLAFDRIVVGQANEVYAVPTEEGQDLILRLAHRPDPKVFTEAAVIEVVRGRGIPAPEVLAVGLLDDDGSATAFILQRRLPGVMLRTVAEAEPLTAARLLEPLGELVAAIHEIHVEGFGSLTPELTGTHAGYGAWFIDMFKDSQLPETLAAVADDQDARRLVRLAFEQMEAARHMLDNLTCRLAHGDLSPDNVLVEAGQVTGVVDWEAVKGAPQANDFAWWTTVSATEALSVEPLLRGYQRVLALDEDFWPVYFLARLRILSSLLGYAANVGDASLLARASAGLREALAETGP